VAASGVASSELLLPASRLRLVHLVDLIDLDELALHRRRRVDTRILTRAPESAQTSDPEHQRCGSGQLRNVP
jgi:hypothetical protein